MAFSVSYTDASLSRPAGIASDMPLFPCTVLLQVSVLFWTSLTCPLPSTVNLTEGIHVSNAAFASSILTAVGSRQPTRYIPSNWTADTWSVASKTPLSLMELLSMVMTFGDLNVSGSLPSIVYPTMACSALGLMPDGSVTSASEAEPALTRGLIAYPDMEATVCPPMS